MKVRSTKSEAKKVENPRIAVTQQLLSMAQFIRRRGTPDEAEEALEWEKRLQERLTQVESETISAAA